MGRKKRLPVYEEVPILDIGAEGKSIARVDNQVVFVTKALPGDVVDIKITRKKKSYMEGLPLRFHQYSDKRVEPFCKHFDLCGGCKWQDLPYSEQLKYKRQQVTDNLERIAKVDLPLVRDILPAPDTRYYRNKMEFTFSSIRWLRKEEMDLPDEEKELRGLGLHIPGRWDKVVDIEHCYLQKEPSNRIRLAVKDFAIRNGYSFFDLRKHEGFLRNLIIRTSSTDEVMVILVFALDDPSARESILDYLKEAFPEITSLFYMINPKANDSIFDLDPVLYYGRAFIYEEMEGLKFKVGPKSFYQTNSRQAYELYKLVRRFANLQGDERVYDLYTGTGTIANFLAPHCKHVVGIESVKEAIDDARQNAELNRLNNTTFIHGDMKELLNEDCFSRYGYPQVLVTDPPRAGMHKDVVSNVLRAEPARIVYVSCNPATQARDIYMLAGKYRVMDVQPVDMFPHTYHVENLVLLEKRLD
ncbi:MAG: 23S rRNA (uracil(1939)-C(5))-methyltransferase RlmD [Bacteroidales bacterium]|nr:23S rRNA (uracil(1939)-C(5))-methyltransferase RlmD [Bacteroidales bacterium]MBS3773794.1 23S rRNA (uracil(1939)-C(5))-methyltransferase RlmD [Bacteroidales bacterium]